MNKMNFHLFDDPREKALRDAIHRAIAALERSSPARTERALAGVGR